MQHLFHLAQSSESIENFGLVEVALAAELEVNVMCISPVYVRVITNLSYFYEYFSWNDNFKLDWITVQFRDGENELGNRTLGEIIYFSIQYSGCVMKTIFRCLNSEQHRRDQALF